jgi:hypothetical protein
VVGCAGRGALTSRLGVGAACRRYIPQVSPDFLRWLHAPRAVARESAPFFGSSCARCVAAKCAFLVSGFPQIVPKTANLESGGERKASTFWVSFVLRAAVSSPRKPGPTPLLPPIGSPGFFFIARGRLPFAQAALGPAVNPVHRRPGTRSNFDRLWSARDLTWTRRVNPGPIPSAASGRDRGFNGVAYSYRRNRHSSLSGCRRRPCGRSLSRRRAGGLRR